MGGKKRKEKASSESARTAENPNPKPLASPLKEIDKVKKSIEIAAKNLEKNKKRMEKAALKQDKVCTIVSPFACIDFIILCVFFR